MAAYVSANSMRYSSNPLPVCLERSASVGTPVSVKYPAAFLASISTLASLGMRFSGIETRVRTSIPEPVIALYFMSLIETNRSIFFTRANEVYTQHVASGSGDHCRLGIRTFLTADEQDAIKIRWLQLSGESCWMDAFYSFMSFDNLPEYAKFRQVFVRKHLQLN